MRSIARNARTLGPAPSIVAGSGVVFTGESPRYFLGLVFGQRLCAPVVCLLAGFGHFASPVVRLPVFIRGHWISPFPDQNTVAQCKGIFSICQPWRSLQNSLPSGLSIPWRGAIMRMTISCPRFVDHSKVETVLPLFAMIWSGLPGMDFGKPDRRLKGPASRVPISMRYLRGNSMGASTRSPIGQAVMRHADAAPWSGSRCERDAHAPTAVAKSLLGPSTDSIKRVGERFCETVHCAISSERGVGHGQEDQQRLGRDGGLRPAGMLKGR